MRAAQGVGRPVPGRVLSVGVRLGDRPNHAETIDAALATSRHWIVDRRWASIRGSTALPGTLPGLTLQEPAPKFEILSRLLGGIELDRYDYLLLTDDDIELPEGFLDRFLELAVYMDFALFQPALTRDSYWSHEFCRQLGGIDARRTRFVEIGPLVAVRRDAYPCILPFPSGIGMGWGLDFLWPIRLEAAGLRVGLVDATPVRHVLRRVGAGYAAAEARAAMAALLASNPHLERHEAFSILEVYCGDSR